MSKKANKDLVILKSVVIIMGVLLIVGTIALFVAVLYKAKQPPKIKEPVATAQPASTIVYTAPPVKETKKCNYKDTQIPISGDVVSASTNNDILTIISRKTTNQQEITKVTNGHNLEMTTNKATYSTQQVVVYDLCEGVVISTIDLVAK